jgi:hypothetical protein
MNEEQMQARRILEALRSGVPNRDAINTLQDNQPDIEQKFAKMLTELKNGKRPEGMIFSGGFGAGKSHMMGYFQEQALRENFACSHISISKETQLFDLSKVFKTAVETMLLPNHTGQAMQELTLKLKPNDPKYRDFFTWSENKLPALFPASLLAHERHDDLEIREKMVGFWIGEPLKLTDLRQALRDIGAANSFTIRSVAQRDLPEPRLRFVSRLVRAAGFVGWIILLDEVELIGRYSLWQRARSYTEMARWFGFTDGLPKVVPIFQTPV